MRILLIEDDPNLCFFLEKYISNKGFNIKVIKDGYEGLNDTFENSYDLFLIDIGLPKVSGFTIVKSIRERKITTPIIIITDKLTADNEIESFKLGANLFHRKPINYELLDTQIKTITKDANIEEVIQIGDLLIDTKRRFVVKNGKEIRLTFSEFKLLMLLIKNKSKILNRCEIIEKVLVDRSGTEAGAVDTLVSRLRKKMGLYRGLNVIETIYKSGFRLSIEYFKGLKESEE